MGQTSAFVPPIGQGGPTPVEPWRPFVEAGQNRVKLGRRTLDRDHPDMTPDWPSRIFSLLLIAIGAYGLAMGQFVAFWVPLVPAPASLKWAIGAACLLGGLGLMPRRSARFAAGFLLAVAIAWLALFKAPAIFAAPLVAGSWESTGEMIVVMAALFCFFGGVHPARIARVLLGVGVCAFGVAHFAYVAPTASLVPKWLPAHAALVYLTGAIFIAAGVALIAGARARGAALVMALQMGVFTLLVWLPQIVAHVHDVGTVSEFLDSAVLTAAAAVVTQRFGASWS